MNKLTSSKRMSLSSIKILTNECWKSSLRGVSDETKDIIAVVTCPYHWMQRTQNRRVSASAAVLFLSLVHRPSEFHQSFRTLVPEQVVVNKAAAPAKQ